jgi:hypothetical protein
MLEKRTGKESREKLAGRKPASRRTRNPQISRGCAKEELPARRTTAATGTAAARTTATAAAWTTTTTATAATGRTILSFIHTQRATAHGIAVQALNGTRCVGIVHFDESEATGTARVAIHDDFHGFDSAMLREEIAHSALISREGKVTNIDLHSCRTRAK